MTLTDRKRLLELHAAAEAEEGNKAWAWPANHAFATAARELVPALVKEVERLEGMVRQQREGNHRIMYSNLRRTEEEREALRAENERLREELADTKRQYTHELKVFRSALSTLEKGDKTLADVQLKDELERLREDVRRLREERDGCYMLDALLPGDRLLEIDILDPSEVPCHENIVDAWLKERGL